MSHRAEQVLDAIVAILNASAVVDGAIYRHRAYSLSPDDAELPALSVEMGADTPTDPLGASNLAFLDSLLEVPIVATVRGTSPEEVTSALLDRRRQIHVALMVDRTLGLAWVIDTRYGGAARPQIDVEPEYCFGRLTCTWVVHYRANLADPS
jgi:hypothetical protein